MSELSTALKQDLPAVAIAPEDSDDKPLVPLHEGGSATKRIHILRHGQAIHNVIRGYPERDPPLTDLGCDEARVISLPFKPDLIICSPMKRTIATALIAFDTLLTGVPSIPMEIWPELREAHNATCNLGVSRAALEQAFPQFDFGRCSSEWDYELYTHDNATRRAAQVAEMLAEREEVDIILVTHRGFISYLVNGPQFKNCELRSYTLRDSGGN